jgi:betaine-homocysteine S-methyltransferase
MNPRKPKGLLERLNAGPVICAEGYLFELERRGYLQAGAFVPEVLVEHPQAVVELHREFLRAGSDVIEALTYYVHREKLKLIGREGELETMNKTALRLAKQVAAEGDALVAGNISNTNIYEPGNRNTEKQIRHMFEEQVTWAKEAGVDFIIAETLAFFGEAMIALEVIQQTGLPSVVTLAIHGLGTLRDEMGAPEACARLKDAGADVVGLNCMRGPQTMLPLMRDIAHAVKGGHLACLPVPYRTTPEQPTFQMLKDAVYQNSQLPKSFPTALDPFVCTRYEMADFAKTAVDLGVRYLGVCCGGAPHHVRSMAEALGKQTPASRFSPDMSKHYSLGNHAQLKGHNQQMAEKFYR